MSGAGELRRATEAANRRRLAELRAIDPRLADRAGRALEAVEERRRRDAAEGAPERAVRLNIGMTCDESTARAVEAYVRERPAVDVVVRAYPAGDGGQ